MFKKYIVLLSISCLSFSMDEPVKEEKASCLTQAYRAVKKQISIIQNRTRVMCMPVDDISEIISVAEATITDSDDSEY